MFPQGGYWTTVACLLHVRGPPALVVFLGSIDNTARRANTLKAVAVMKGVSNKKPLSKAEIEIFFCLVSLSLAHSCD